MGNFGGSERDDGSKARVRLAVVLRSALRVGRDWATGWLAGLVQASSNRSSGPRAKLGLPFARTRRCR